MKTMNLFFDNQLAKVYRWFVFPFVKLWLMITRHVIFRMKGYADHKTRFEGYNYVGQDSFLTSCILGRGTYVADFSKKSPNGLILTAEQRFKESTPPVELGNDVWMIIGLKIIPKDLQIPVILRDDIARRICIKVKSKRIDLLQVFYVRYFWCLQ